MKYEKIVPYKVSAEDLLIQLLEYMEDIEDADHDGEGFIANEEMKLATDIKQLLHQLEKENKL